MATEKAIQLTRNYYEEVCIAESIKTTVKLTENFIFCYVTFDLTCSAGMKRYGMFTFSYLATDVYYSNVNVIDKYKDYSIEDIVSQTKNFFSYRLKELKRLGEVN